ncbi:MAG TPA: type II toxin-antitoxin system VapC family toxin [Acetobacteraceae bacterium]|nr:type II toxin-antitoxin system VapC family toxin [Acetobacteraceae bacterium]
MTAYLDASVLVALFIKDALTAQADAFLRAKAPLLVVSDFAAAECVSAIGRRVRIGKLTVDEARTAFVSLDVWATRATQYVEVVPGDVRAADGYLRRLDLTLRTPDALNIAIAQRIGATLATFDKRMAASARALGTDLALL